MLSNFKTWFQNTAVSIIDEKSSLKNLSTTVRQNSSNQSYSISTNNLNDFDCKLKLNSNLNNSTSALLTKKNLAEKNKTTVQNENGCIKNVQNFTPGFKTDSDVDLSNLSREEKEHIEFVLKKADDYVILDNTLRRRSNPYSCMSLNKKDFAYNNQLAVNRTVSSRSSSISSMSSNFSQHDHQATSTPDTKTPSRKTPTNKCTGMSDLAFKNSLEIQTKPPSEFNLTRIKFNEKHRNSIGATSNINKEIIKQLDRKNSTASDTVSSSYIAGLRHAEFLKSTKLDKKSWSRNYLAKMITKAESSKEISQQQTNSNRFKNSAVNVTESRKHSEIFDSSAKNQEQLKQRRILPNTPSILNGIANKMKPSSSSSSSIFAQTALNCQVDENLEQQKKPQDHVSDWLKKSFLNEVNITVPQHAKPMRRNSTSNVRLVVEEPIVEINLTRQFYLKKQNLERKNSGSKLNDSFSYAQLSKSQTNMPIESDKEFNGHLDDSLKKILLYKDPKELSFEISQKNGERRPSLKFGMEIESKQLIQITKAESFELNEDTSRAIVTSIEPDGLIDQFNVSINEGDEIVEVCGVTLRNKDDNQIDRILDETCKQNNGEIELLVRRSLSSINPIERKNSDDTSSSQNNFQRSYDSGFIVSSTDKYQESDYYEQGSVCFNPRGFNEISIKKKPVKSKNYEMLIADPALLYAAIKNKRSENQSRSFSPSINRFIFDRTNDKPPDLISNENDNIKASDNNQEKYFPEPQLKPRHSRKLISPVDLDQFRALSNTNFSKQDHKISFSYSNCDDSEQYDKKWNEERKHIVMDNENLFKNESVLSSQLAAKESHLRLDEKSSGYNSNQSTPTSDINSAKLNADQFSVNKSSPKLGEVLLQLSHSEESKELCVKIIKARDLISSDSNGFSDPYCKLCMLPGRESENKRRTKTVFKNLNPIWNETFIFPDLYREEAENKILEFTFYDWDRFSRDDFLGILKIDLKDSVYLDNEPRWFALEEPPRQHLEVEQKSKKNSRLSRLSFKRNKSLRRRSFR